ncbi:MAG: hypothetical protein N2449_07520, partial [Bacteroidales bacterium]|nr:hypothetical protein [Bacteroidales bacterium]
MKKIILIFTTIVVSSVCLFSQGIIALHHNGFTQIFKGTSAFSDAYNAAQNGDTMYLSGGYFWPVAINKRLVIFGAGHFPDSTAATGVTYIQGNLELNPDADSLYLEGLYINGNIQYSGGDLKIDYLIIRRCMIVGALVLNGNRTTPSLYNT